MKYFHEDYSSEFSNKTKKQAPRKFPLNGDETRRKDRKRIKTDDFSAQRRIKRQEIE